MKKTANTPSQTSVLSAKTKLAIVAQHTDELLHELRVYQIELEMQNDELRHVYSALEQSRDRYVDLYEFAPIGYLSVTLDGVVSEINLTGATLLGTERKNLINCRFESFVVPEDRDSWHSHLLHIKQQGRKHNCELRLCRTDNTTFYARLDSLLIESASLPMVRVMLTDITERRKIDAELRIAATAFESQEAIMITDANSTILKVNRAFADMTGYFSDEVIGQTPKLLNSGKHDAAFYAVLWDSIKETGTWQGEIWNRRKSGEIYPNWMTITAVKDDNGIISHYVSIHTDISARKAATVEIERLSFYDPLTDLPNRRHLMNRLRQALAYSARHGRGGALLFIDLDNFKTLNDTLGHNKGDLLLKKVALRLIASVRENDTVARLGGDEFVVMLENLSDNPEEAGSHARAVGMKILSDLSQLYKLDHFEYHNTLSIGIALFDEHHDSVETLLKWADIAMYQAKASGRNTLRFFDPRMQEVITSRATLETELHQALLDKQFKAYFQMQVNHDGVIIGAEALIRWQHPTRGLVTPLEFIPLAEEVGLIVPIGHWMLETACRQLKKWEEHPATCHLQLAVNVSVRQFHQADFVEQVVTTLKKIAINPSKLKLELTETLILGDIDDTIVKMNFLRNIGVRFSMDDFGTGYSSLSYLTQLPLDQIKIDQSFVRNIDVKLSDAVMVQTIIGMTKNLGIEVIAEGVETKDQQAFLEQYGCLLSQGYLFGKPVPLEIFESLLKEKHSTHSS